jgi:hypothetical protein
MQSRADASQMYGKMAKEGEYLEESQINSKIFIRRNQHPT